MHSQVPSGCPRFLLPDTLSCLQPVTILNTFPVIFSILLPVISLMSHTPFMLHRSGLRFSPNSAGLQGSTSVVGPNSDGLAAIPVRHRDRRFRTYWDRWVARLIRIQATCRTTGNSAVAALSWRRLRRWPVAAASGTARRTGPARGGKRREPPGNRAASGRKGYGRPASHEGGGLPRCAPPIRAPFFIIPSPCALDPVIRPIRRNGPS